MDRTLIEAWQKIEADELLLEKKKPAKVSAIKTSPKGKVTAVKGKQLDEDGVGGPAGAGAGAASNTYSAGDQIVKSGAAAVAPAKLGAKASKYPNKNEKFKKVQEVDQNLKNAATQAAANAVSNVKAGKGTAADATLVGQVAEEELPEAPGPEVPADIAADLGGEEGGEAAPEAAVEPGVEDPAGEEGEDVSVDAETAEQVVDAIMKQYPGAVITISVQLPEETPFDTDLVAAAQEVVGGGEEAPADVDGAEAAPEVNPELDGVPAEEPEKDPAAAMMEKRKVIISKTRQQIKEMFAGMQEEEPVVDPAADAAPVAPEADPAADPAAVEAPVEDVLEPEVEVGDSKIALTPEQWGQVLATTDLLNAGGEGEEAGSEIELPGEEGGEEAPAEEAPAEEPAAEEGDDEKLEELKTEVDLDAPDAKMKVVKKIEKSDFAKDKKQDVAIKKEAVNESFNAELAGYAQALQKLISE